MGPFRLPAWLQVVRWGSLAMCVALAIAHFAKESPAERQRRELAARVEALYDRALRLQANGRWLEARAIWFELLHSLDAARGEDFEPIRATCRREIAGLNEKLAAERLTQYRREAFVYDASVLLVNFDRDAARRLLIQNLWVLSASGDQADEAKALYAVLRERIESVNEDR